jgi:hypothetical protein
MVHYLSAERAGRNWSDMVGALFDGAEREWANTTQVGLLDVPGIGIMNHIEECIVKQKKMCEKSEHRRCEHCAAGNRGGCTLVSD